MNYGLIIGFRVQGHPARGPSWEVRVRVQKGRLAYAAVTYSVRCPPRCRGAKTPVPSPNAEENPPVELGFGVQLRLCNVRESCRGLK